MKKFRVIVTRTDEYVIEIDETQYDEKKMQEFRDQFYGFTDLEEHAKHIAQLRARFHSESFFEGYGVIKMNGEFPFHREGALLEPAINLIPIDEGNVEDIYCVEVKE